METPFLSGDNIKVTEELGVRLSGRAKLAVKGCLGRDLVTGKQYSSCVSVSITWTSGGLVPTDTTG